MDDGAHIVSFDISGRGYFPYDMPLQSLVLHFTKVLKGLQAA